MDSGDKFMSMFEELGEFTVEFEAPDYALQLSFAVQAVLDLEDEEVDKYIDNFNSCH